MRYLFCLGLSLLCAVNLLAQTPAALPDTTTATPKADELNFDEFSDADSRPVRSFCTQKVLMLSPTRLISLGYETQTPFNLTSAGNHLGKALTVPTERLAGYGGVRLALNTPVISRSNLIINLGLTYWNTNVNVPAATAEASSFFRPLSRGLRSTGLNVTVFKPFDSRRFLIVQANADANGTYRGFGDLTGKAITLSATAIYGWKRDDNFMWGLGLTRTYRAGQLLHIPVVLVNRTFSPKWGVEAIFPAKVNLRRSFGTTSLLMLGYEIEGNAYYLGTQATTGQDLFVRRGELKPRITYERKLSGFVWLSAQAGYRYNWRFDAFSGQNPVSGEQPVFKNTLGGAPYVNISLNLVSP